MGWDGSRNFVPITSYHPITITVICTTHQLPVGGMSAYIYHPIDFPIPLSGVASHPIHNPPLELSTIPPHTHIQPPRYHRTAIIFLDISRKAGPLPPIAFALSAYYSYILHILCSCCEAVCLNGGQQLRESVTALVEGKLSSFTGSVASGGSAGADASSSGGPGASASGSGGFGAGANSSGRDNGAGSPEAAGTGALRGRVAPGRPHRPRPFPGWAGAKHNGTKRSPVPPATWMPRRVELTSQSASLTRT